MRSSSIKSLVVTLSLVATVSATTLSVEARPAQAPRNTVTSPGSTPAARFATAWTRVTRALRRLAGTITMGVPSVPLPGAESITTPGTPSNDGN
jgi:hypothetical protein